MALTLTWTLSTLIALAVIIGVLAWFYERASNEVALVKTGVGGRKVVLDGGALVVPYFHDVSRVNMQTLRLDVHRAGESSLITKDRLRVDVGVEFYVSVTPSAEAVTRAAQTLGRRTFQADQLRDLIDGMLVDAMRTVAARVTMDELHEDRGAFVGAIRDTLGDSLTRYGLQLDSVSLTALDQTPFSALDENNAFNAVGMRKLAEVIAKSKKERAEIDADAEVSVRQAAVEATKRRLQIDLEERRAEIAQQQEVETLLAAQLAEVAHRKADAERAAAEARIRMEHQIQAADIARERDLAVAEQESRITVAAKSQEESQAQAAADLVRAEAAKAEATIQTAREVAEAERRREITLVAAQEAADAAENRAKARRAAADAGKYEKMAEAEAARARIEAENLRAEHIAAMETDLARLEAMPKIVAEMVKPAEKIKDVHIHHLSGLGRSGPDGTGETATNQIVNSIMEMAVQLPALKRMGEEVGLNLDGTVSEIVNDEA